MRIVLAGILLLCVLPVRAAEPGHALMAKRFRDAFRAKDSGTMAILAAQPAKNTPYALVVYALLESREYEAARKLVHYRAAAPDGPGLKRLQQGYENGVRASRAQQLSWRKSDALLRDRKPDKALEVIRKWGMPPAGTVTGARLAWVRANALVMLDQHTGSIRRGERVKVRVLD